MNLYIKQNKSSLLYSSIMMTRQTRVRKTNLAVLLIYCTTSITSNVHRRGSMAIGDDNSAKRSMLLARAR